MTCTVAPSSESSIAPASPAAAVINKSGRVETGLANRPPASPIRAAPPSAARVPHPVTPPDDPGSTICRVVIRRGGAGLRTPSSVAHVSALTAAMAPAKAR